MSQGVSLQNRGMCWDRSWCGWQISSWPANFLLICEPGMFEIGSSGGGGDLWGEQLLVGEPEPRLRREKCPTFMIRGSVSMSAKCRKKNAGISKSSSFLLLILWGRCQYFWGVLKTVFLWHKISSSLDSGWFTSKFVIHIGAHKYWTCLDISASNSLPQKKSTHTDQWAQMQDSRTCFCTCHVADGIVGRKSWGLTSLRCSFRISRHSLRV